MGDEPAARTGQAARRPKRTLRPQRRDQTAPLTQEGERVQDAGRDDVGGGQGLRRGPLALEKGDAQPRGLQHPGVVAAVAG